MYSYFIAVRSAVLVFLTHRLALPLLRLMRSPEIFPYNMEMLAAMPEGMLGNDLFRFLGSKQLELLTYYAKHDIKHILLDYDTTDEGEVCLQSFMLGNGHISFPVAATVLYGFLTMPEYWPKFFTAFKRGKAAPSLRDWKFTSLINCETITLKLKINESHKRRSRS